MQSLVLIVTDQIHKSHSLSLFSGSNLRQEIERKYRRNPMQKSRENLIASAPLSVCDLGVVFISKDYLCSKKQRHMSKIEANSHDPAAHGQQDQDRWL